MDLTKFEFQSDRIFTSLTSEERSLVLDQSDLLRFKKGKLLFYEGGIPTGAFVIEEGRAKIYKTGIDGKDQIFYIYKTGDMMGYHALLCDEPFEDSCEVMEDSKVRFISKRNFEHLMSEIPRLRMLLIQNMSHEFGVLVNVITVLAQKPLRQRLALFLLILNDRFPRENGILLSRVDLANIVGTARETLGRLLKDFREEGLIEGKGKSILIRDVDGLRRIADS